MISERNGVFTFEFIIYLRLSVIKASLQALHKGSKNGRIIKYCSLWQAVNGYITSIQKQNYQILRGSRIKPMNGVYFSSVILALFWGFGASYSYAKSFDDKALIESFNAASKGRNRQQYLLNYVKQFPQNKRDFLKTFESNKKIAPDAMSYLFLLEDALVEEPEETMKLLLGLAATLQYQSGVVDTFQLVLGKSCASHPATFAKIFKPLTPKWQNNVIRFLKAGPKGPATGFNTLVMQLENAGESDLAFELKTIE